MHDQCQNWDNLNKENRYNSPSIDLDRKHASSTSTSTQDYTRLTGNSLSNHLEALTKLAFAVLKSRLAFPFLALFHGQYTQAVRWALVRKTGSLPSPPCSVYQQRQPNKQWCWVKRCANTTEVQSSGT